MRTSSRQLMFATLLVAVAAALLLGVACERDPDTRTDRATPTFLTSSVRHQSATSPQAQPSATSSIATLPASPATTRTFSVTTTYVLADTGLELDLPSGWSVAQVPTLPDESYAYPLLRVWKMGEPATVQKTKFLRPGICVIREYDRMGVSSIEEWLLSIRMYVDQGGAQRNGSQALAIRAGEAVRVLEGLPNLGGRVATYLLSDERVFMFTYVERWDGIDPATLQLIAARCDSLIRGVRASSPGANP